MPRPIVPLVLSQDDQEQLERWLAALGTPQQVALRCRIVLGISAGKAEVVVAAENGMNRKTVRLWRARFLAQGLQGLWEIAPGRGRKPTYDSTRIKTLIDATLQSKPRGSTHWSCRTMAEAQGISKSTVNNIWRSHNIKPHRTQTFKLSRDPRFLEKLTDVVGLYLNPPDKAMVLCVDEKSQIQALDRTQPMLPMGLGYVEGVTHDYVRHGTTTLFAALDVASGRVLTSCKRRHRHQEYLAFLKEVDESVPRKLDIHLVVDNYATHKHPRVQRWLAAHPRYHVHYTPTYASWLNQVEIWFNLITQRAIRRGTFRSVKDLITKIDNLQKFANYRCDFLQNYVIDFNDFWICCRAHRDLQLSY